MWKEYALSDSRYLTSDAFVTCMEGMTALLWGPLSLLCAHWIVTRHAARHPLQMTISIGQLYGVVLYYATCAFEERHRTILYSIPSQVHFWGYYVFLNAFWFFIPIALIWQSFREATRALAAAQKAKAA